MPPPQLAVTWVLNLPAEEGDLKVDAVYCACATRMGAEHTQHHVTDKRTS